MLVDFPNGSTEDIQLYTLDGTYGVYWADGVGVVRQDGQVTYAVWSVFRDSPDPNSGKLYQLGSDYHIRPYGAAQSSGPTTNQATQPAPSPNVVNVSAGPTGTTKAPNLATDPNVRAAAGTAGTLGAFFGQQLRLGQGFSIPYWVLGAGGLALMLRRRRRR